MIYYLISVQHDDFNAPIGIFTNKRKCYDFARLDSYRSQNKDVDFMSYKTFSERLRKSGLMKVGKLLVNALVVNPEHKFRSVIGLNWQMNLHELSEVYISYLRFAKQTENEEHKEGKEYEEKVEYAKEGLERISGELFDKLGIITKYLGGADNG